jgi:steroid 5-alpha reductase family enzyme
MMITLAVVWIVAAIGMAATWAFSMRVKNVGFVDVSWAGLMAIAAIICASMALGNELNRVLVALFGGFWGLRLCLHLMHRVLHEDEDGRYQALRAAWNGSSTKFFWFFQAQAIIVLLFSLPFVAAAANPHNDFSIQHALALLIWLVSIGGEWLSDRQLSAFRENPANKGKTCRVGLWAWSRHPNYFFEWLHWWAYVALAFNGPLFWLSFMGPVVMFAFLYRVSGIPWTEAQSLRSRGEDYARYQREVSAFFPWPPKVTTL